MTDDRETQRRTDRDAADADAAQDDAADVTRRTTGTADAAGATSGAHVGAVLGAAGGPAGVLAGGAAGGLAGWLAGATRRDAAALSEEEDEHYRRLHEDSAESDTVPYDHVRDLYRLGHHMGEHPDYSQRDWSEIEPELRDAWTAVQRETWGEWGEAEPFVRRGYEH